MSLMFRYQQVRVRRRVVTLSGQFVRPRTLIPTTLIGPTSTEWADCLLDTGADDTVFPEAMANKLGIDLTNAPVGEVTGVAAAPSPVRFAQITLRLTDGVEFLEWTAWVGFSSARLRQPLLGFAGTLQFFHALFRGDVEEVEMTPNTLFPGRYGKLLPSTP